MRSSSNNSILKKMVVFLLAVLLCVIGIGIINNKPKKEDTTPLEITENNTQNVELEDGSRLTETSIETSIEEPSEESTEESIDPNAPIELPFVPVS